MFDEAAYFISKIKSPKAGITLLFIEKYVNAGINQYKRIKQHEKEIREELSRTRTLKAAREPLQNIFFDIHFYFICWDKVAGLFLKLLEIVGDDALSKIKTEYEKDFATYSEVRNHLEHIDERLMGKAKGKMTAKFAGDLGNLANNHYSFWGRKYYIGEKSVERLKEFYTALLNWAKSQSGPKPPLQTCLPVGRGGQARKV